MDRLNLGTALVLLASALIGCADVAQPAAPAHVVAEARNVVTTIVAPAPTPPPPPTHAACYAVATSLIVRWEVTSPAVYTRKYQGVIDPGGQSGPTWAIGFDGGHNTRASIAEVWADHEDLSRLLTTSGVIGAETRRRIGEWRGVVTDYQYAIDSFRDYSLPIYHAQARKTYGRAMDTLPPGACAAVLSLTYNRGGATTGDRRREIRTIRDQCIPNRDVECIAEQLESMCRLWPDTPGLCNRRKDEARTARGRNQ